jgi:hypothetical protein
VYESTGRREQAKAEYKAALELDPSLADARSRLEELQGRSATESAPAPTGLSNTTE